MVLTTFVLTSRTLRRAAFQIQPVRIVGNEAHRVKGRNTTLQQGSGTHVPPRPLGHAYHHGISKLPDAREVEWEKNPGLCQVVLDPSCPLSHQQEG